MNFFSMRVFLAYSIVVSIAAISCIDKSQITGAPCPCPAGYKCCTTLYGCIENNVICPDTYPPSSSLECDYDDQCGKNESCSSWYVSGHGILGSRQCRSKCSPQYQCSEGESCELSLSGGAPMASMNISYLCLPKEKEPQCEGKGCSTCSDIQLGTSWCDNTLIEGCFFSLDPICGLTCKIENLYDCSPNKCKPGNFGPKCDDEIDGPDGGVDGDGGTFLGYPPDCGDCAGIADPGMSGCVDDDIATCWVADSWCENCGLSCILEFTPCPEGWTCIDNLGATCIQD